MPKYAALIYIPQHLIEAAESDETRKVSAAYMTYTEDVQKAGVLRGGEGLMPATMATSVRVQDGKTVTMDGPFAETKEQLGGFYVFECKDLDEAITWAAKIPDASRGTIELRPLIQM
ncbi:MAG TPA: YciI family protein [Chloroflexota bacterium]|nr:YciI family protein [Chloroflexota bacterium]